jgi:hypothetical protein
LKAAQQEVAEDRGMSHKNSTSSISDIKSTYHLLDPKNRGKQPKLDDQFPKLMQELNDANS